MSAHKKEKEFLLAIFAVLLAALCNTLMVAFVKFGTEGAETIPSIIFWRSLWALFFLVPIMTYFYEPKLAFFSKLKTHRIGMIIFRACTGFFSIFLFFYCASKLTLTDATLLYFTIPLFVPIIAYIWKRDKIPALNWIGIGLGFVGVILVIKPSQNLFHLASIAGLFSGIIAAIGQVTIHQLSSTESSGRINFYYFLFTAFFALIVTLFQPEKNWLGLTAYDYLNFFVIGVFGLGYLYFISVALKHGPPALISSFLYTTVVYAIIIDWLIWKKVIDIMTIIGAVFVIAGAVLKFYLHKRHARR